MNTRLNEEEIGGPAYEAFVKVVIGADPTATSFALEAGKFTDLVDKLEALIEEFKARGVEMVEGRPFSGVI